MHAMKSVLTALATFVTILCLTSPAFAQPANYYPTNYPIWPPPPTQLESMTTNTGTVIIRGTVLIGTVATDSATISLKCRELTDVGTGRRVYGVAIGMGAPNQTEDVSLVDSDEVEPLLNAIDYLITMDWTATSLPGLDATYTTRGGFRVVAYGNRQVGSIQFAVRNTHTSPTPVQITRLHITQLRNLLDQAKQKLAELKGSQ